VREITPGRSGNNRFAYVRTYETPANAKRDFGKRDGESARATRLQHVHRERMLRRCIRRCPERIARGCVRIVRVRYVRETIYTIYGTRRVHAHADTQYGVFTYGAHGLPRPHCSVMFEFQAGCVGVARGWRFIHVVLPLLLRMRTHGAIAAACVTRRTTREKNEMGEGRKKERERRVCLHACRFTPPARYSKI